MPAGLLPTLAMFIGVCALVPLIAVLVGRRRDDLRRLPWWVWLALFLAAAVVFFLFMVRKQWERAMVFANPDFWFVLTVAQLENNFWEEIARLLVFFLFAALLGRRFTGHLARPGSALVLGYWIGLGYGVGEALTLVAYALLPGLARTWSDISYLVFFVNWPSVLDRLVVVQIHAIVGGLLGLGVSCFCGTARRWYLLVFFAVAIGYHELVNGIVIAVQYYGRTGFFNFLARTVPYTIYPFDLAVGYALLFGLRSLVMRHARSGPNRAAHAVSV